MGEVGLVLVPLLSGTRTDVDLEPTHKYKGLGREEVSTLLQFSLEVEDSDNHS